MLMPKKVKYRKQQRGRRTGKAFRGGALAFGDYGLKALEPAWITDRQIEASRVAITRFIKRGGKLGVVIHGSKSLPLGAGPDLRPSGRRHLALDQINGSGHATFGRPAQGRKT